MDVTKLGATAPFTIPEIDRIGCGNCGITFERLASNDHNLCEQCDGWLRSYFAQQVVTRALRQARGGRGQQRQRQSETVPW